jgi:periplasmic divalent cation tolerance protein
MLPSENSDSRFYDVPVTGKSMTDQRLVLSTCGSLEEAQTVADALVERRLAACVNIVPQVQSVYRWQGEVERATEWLLLIKTTADACDRLSQALSQLHSYDLPECLILAIEGGSPAYLKWIQDSVT